MEKHLIAEKEMDSILKVGTILEKAIWHADLAIFYSLAVHALKKHKEGALEDTQFVEWIKFGHEQINAAIESYPEFNKKYAWLLDPDHPNWNKF